jgi:hypothetical protein
MWEIIPKYKNELEKKNKSKNITICPRDNMENFRFELVKVGEISRGRLVIATG